MRARSLNVLPVLAFALFSASSLHAANLRFLDYSPITYLKKKDNADLHKAAADVLENSKDGESTNWSNEGLGNIVPITAEITAADTVTGSDQTCRNLRVVLHARGQDQTVKVPVCKREKAQWVIEKK